MVVLRQFLAKVYRLPKTIISIRLRKIATLNQLRQNRQFMKPGWYRIEGKFVYRIGSDIPPGLLQTKGRLAWNSLKVQQRIRYTLINRVVPPNWTYLSTDVQDKDTQCEQLLVTFTNGVKLFGPRNKIILSHFGDPVHHQHLLHAYNTIHRYLPVVKTAPYGHTGMLCESLVDGPLMQTATLEQQKVAYADLLQGFVRLTAQCANDPFGVDQARSAVNKAIEILSRLEIGNIIYDMRSDIEMLLRDAPLVPAHGDMHANNIILTSNGPIIIDLETLDYLIEHPNSLDT